MRELVVVTMDARPASETTLTYLHEADRAIFSGAVDETNIEIFRDLLWMLPPGRDAVICIADLELRVPEASALLIERARALGKAHRLVLTTDDGPPRLQ